MSLPKKCLVDTNVPKTANLATQPDEGSDVYRCLRAGLRTRRLSMSSKARPDH